MQSSLESPKIILKLKIGLYNIYSLVQYTYIYKNIKAFYRGLQKILQHIYIIQNVISCKIKVSNAVVYDQTIQQFERICLQLSSDQKTENSETK